MAELLSDFLDSTEPVIPHIIGRGLLPMRGKMIIGGEPKTNKSYVVMNMALDLSIGRCLFGAQFQSGAPVLPVHKQVTVLYIEQEIGAQGLRVRLKTMVSEPGAHRLYVKTRDMGMRLDTEKGRVAIAAEIEQVKPDVIILDPMAKFHLSDENSAQHMGAILRVIDHWVETYGCAVIIVHHTGKENYEHPRRGGNRLRGSSAIFGDVDCFIEVTRKSASHHKEPVLELSFDVRQDAPLDPIYIKRLITGQCEYLGENFHWGRPENHPKDASKDPSKEPYKDL